MRGDPGAEGAPPNEGASGVYRVHNEAVRLPSLTR
jgi:hypothetical protein